MGIAGLTPFLLKNFPNVVKQLPDRLQSFSGKKIAIDGTLITQRFWFSPDLHHYRHVRGWYRLITELETAGVGAICVFDGAGRTAAKQEEHKRRAKDRALVARRAELEKDRKDRLNRFTTILEKFQKLSPTQKVEVTQIIKELSLNSWKVSEVPVLASEATPIQEPAKMEPEAVASGDTEEGYAAELFPEAHVSPEELRSLLRRMTVLYRDYLRSSRQDQLTPVICATPLPDQTPTPSTDDIASSLEKLSLTSIDSDGAVERQVEVAMSKIQAQLASDEGAVWADLIHSFTQPDTVTAEHDNNLEDITDRLRKLASTSEHWWQSYHKRTLAPTTETYEQCRSLLAAMGVPVVEAPFPFEAEGVAASLCVNGFADAVGSEDTDVLIYEAPLLRNLTSVNQPLLHISGTDVREALKLTRESYVDFALLLGSDFSQRLHGLGPSRAIKLIQSEKSIEAVIASERRKEKPPRFLPEPRLTEAAYFDQIGSGREVFMTLPPITENLKTKIVEKIEPDRAAVVDILRAFDLHSDVWKADDWTNLLDVDYYGTAEHELEAQDSYIFQ